MTFGTLLHTFATDDKLKIALIAIALDFFFGVLAAFHQGNFRLSYISDFLRNDVEFKLVPWFILYAAAVVAGNVGIGPFDIGAAAGAAYVTIIAAWAASILGSLNELRLAGGNQTLLTALAGQENASPPKD